MNAADLACYRQFKWRRRCGPRPLSVGVVHAPRCRCPTRRACSRPRPANPPEKPVSVRARFDVVPWVHAEGHHVREHARSARRPARFSARSDRTLCARLARAGVGSWMAVTVSERETLTAPLSERVPWQLRDGRKTDDQGAITRAAASSHLQGPATVRTRCAARDVTGRSPPWTTRGR